MTDIYYRANIQVYGNGDVCCSLQKFYLIKRTPKGAWVSDYAGSDQPTWAQRKFILDSAERKYCYPTVEAAMYSLLRRKQRQVSILTNQLRRTQACLDALNAGIKPNDVFGLSDGINLL